MLCQVLRSSETLAWLLVATQSYALEQDLLFVVTDDLRFVLVKLMKPSSSFEGQKRSRGVVEGVSEFDPKNELPLGAEQKMTSVIFTHLF
jgi:hypothetical protein